MKQKKTKDAMAAKRLLDFYKLLDFYNMLANLFWSVPVFVLLTIFCYQFMPIALLIAYLLPTLLCLFLSNSIFDQMRAGSTTSFYKRIGVGLVNRFSQNGTIVHRLVRKQFPDYKAVRYSKDSVISLLSQSYLFEKFHFAAAVFTTLLILQAFITHLFGWAIVLTIINVFYNFYPILFQQYVRLKLKAFTKNETKLSRSSSSGSCQLLLRSFR